MLTKASYGYLISTWAFVGVLPKPQYQALPSRREAAERRVYGPAQALSLRSQLAHPVRWVLYDHGTRLALLGTGEQGLWLQGYQFAADGLVKLPPFQIAASTPGATPAPPAASRLDPKAVKLLALYGRAYAAFLDRPGRRLLLYRLFRDAVVLAHSYAAGAPDFELGVADHLLLVHQPAARRVLLLDVAAPAGSPAPPLALALEPAPGGARADPGAWRYCLPNLVLDAGAGAGASDDVCACRGCIMCYGVQGVLWSLATCDPAPDVCCICAAKALVQSAYLRIQA